VNKKTLAAISAISGLIFALGVGVTPAMAMPELTSVAFSADTVPSLGGVDLLINGSVEGEAYFVGCQMARVNGLDIGMNEDHSELVDPPTTRVTGLPNISLIPNFFATDLLWQVQFYTDTLCSEVTDDTIPDLESNVLIEAPLLAFDSVDLVEGVAANEAVPFSSAGDFLDWSAGGIVSVVTDNNCAPLTGTLERDDVPTSLPLGLSLTSVPSESGQPTFSFSGTPPTGSTGTYRACVNVKTMTTDNVAYAWVTFNVAAAPATLASTGVDVLPIAAGSSFIAVSGLLLLIVRRRRTIGVER
jgi:hypothetical protein